MRYAWGLMAPFANGVPGGRPGPGRQPWRAAWPRDRNRGEGAGHPPPRAGSFGARKGMKAGAPAGIHFFAIAY